MRNYGTCLFIAAFCCLSYGPPNCNLYRSDSLCYKACLEAEKAVRHPQGSKASQEHFDQSIANCPSFDYSYYQQSVPYAKRGLIRQWKVMIDKAVAINPQEHLSNRAWYHFFFMHNYESAIQDIEQLEALVHHDIGYTGDGDYHLNIMKALCFKGLEQQAKAISIIEQQLSKPDYSPAYFDYLHLGVSYLEIDSFKTALECFEKQETLSNISELHYYSALCHQALNNPNQQQQCLQEARRLYINEQRMSNPYRQMIDEIYLIDIDKAISNMQIP